MSPKTLIHPLHRPVMLVMIGWLLAALPSHAGNASTSTAAGSTTGNSSFSLGYVFTVSSNQNVTALGQFDVKGDGVISTAKAALFNWSTGAKLAETTMAAATLEETGHYDTHFVNLASPVTLSFGTQYLVVTEVTGTDCAYGKNIMTFDPAIAWVAGRATPVGSPAMPATATTTTFSIVRTTDPCYFGPNMKLTPGVTDPFDISLGSPTNRRIVQRSAANTGSIPVAGNYKGTPSRIEARAVVMTGSGNSGTSTGWQTIVAAPTGGVFSASLANVPAGGWYQLEVRGVYDGTPGTPTVVQKIGVGDIYVTCGQSNSANHGSGGYTASDDRVCARTAVAGSNWVLAADPIPIASGTGGSVWPRLGALLAAQEDIPIGFIAVGVGSTQVNQWIPGSANYNTLLKPAIQSFPASGFRAALWHQGESDSIAATTAATYKTRLSSIISQSRTDAGWQIPWYVAEASFHPNTTLSVEEPVAAGQRATVHGDPLVFLGPSTDEFHLEDASGGKLVDSVHFNSAGLLAHAQQWRDILRGTAPLTPRNGNFEENRTPSITGLSPLADGVNYLITPASNNDSPAVLGWRILNAGGTGTADGSNGFHNPTTGTYAAAVDTTLAGVLANMAGKHVAVLDGGSAGNSFLHSTRALAMPNMRYSLTVAIGVRDDPATFGTARLEIIGNGTVAASGTFTKANLDALRGGDASGSFTDVAIAWTSGASMAANQPLSIRIVKEGGAGTVLDFDNVRLTSSPLPRYQSWISDPAYGIDPTLQGFTLDPDGDGLPNGLEAWLGSHPGQPSAGLTAIHTDGTSTTFSHSIHSNLPSDLTGSYEWSLGLIDWYAGDGVQGPAGGPTVAISHFSEGNTTHVTATANPPTENLFLRLRVGYP
jgi:hypothetical protein